MRRRIGLLVGFVCMAAATVLGENVTPLVHGWTLEPGCSLTETGAQISTAQYRPGGKSYQISVPSTVLAAQVASGEFPDPYFDMNLRKIPGTSYPIGENFSNLPMPADSPYRCAWWYRKQFPVPSSIKGRTLTLHFAGINYRANLWVNGKLVADDHRIAGAYRTYDFDITKFVHPGGSNVVAVQTFAPTDTDLGINWVDWSPCPPDKDMGLTGRVDLLNTGPVSIVSPMVVTQFPKGSLDRALLTVYGEVRNDSAQPVHGEASATLLAIHVEQPVDLLPGEQKTVVFSPDRYPQLAVQHPAVWWPYSMGTPHLENLTMRFSEDGSVSDEQQIRFGIREITSELTAKGARLFRVNGKPILIRGGGWSQDMMLRENPERLRQEFALVRDLNLNAIRLEGKLETDQFYQLADEQGVLVMAGWCCCDQWEHWAKWTVENHGVAEASLRSQMLRLRGHASLLVWLNGSDNPPPPDVEQAYLGIENEAHWPNPTLSSATARPTVVSGANGVKMSGPYDYVGPSYWLVNTSRYGGAFGYNTETSPGPAIPTVYSLRKFLPADQLWPQNSDWSFHNGGGGFKNLTVFDTAMDATYGTPQSLEDYERMSQAMAYNGERAMFEAYSRNKYTSTGVVQWMLNNAWPSTIWHLFDYYLDAAGGYFGAKKACEPVHIQYSYDDHSVYVVNSTYIAQPREHATVHVYDVHLKPLFSGEADVQAGADSSNRVLSIPEATFASGAQVYFVQLALTEAQGKPVSENFYWVPSKLTTFDWAKTDYTHTPALTYPTMTELRSLPAATVRASVLGEGETPGAEVRIVNTSHALALQVSLRALDAKGEAIEPVFWTDNYVSLMPGESRTLRVKLWPEAGSKVSSVVIGGWNVAPVTLKVSRMQAAQSVAQR